MKQLLDTIVSFYSDGSKASKDVDEMIPLYIVCSLFCYPPAEWEEAKTNLFYAILAYCRRVQALMAAGDSNAYGSGALGSKKSDSKKGSSSEKLSKFDKYKAGCFFFYLVCKFHETIASTS